ncbi:MAG: hypothetical protein PHC49_11015 [Desulfuromonadaceae bacterium]|nr:hypothetical protein [Desulfuromonadaceae bacterium]
MQVLLTRSTLTLITLIQLVVTAAAGPLDEYYLQQFGEEGGQQLQKAILSISSATVELPRCGMPLKHTLQRDWRLLEPSTQKVLAKQLAYPTLPSAYLSSSGHFKIHYSTTGSDAPPQTDSNYNGIPDWVETVAATFEHVYNTYYTEGYQPAPGIPYDIYLRDLSSSNYYGVTTGAQSAANGSYPHSYTSWIEIDNNFSDSIYRKYTPLENLQVTAAHEYHHAIQYGYNYFFDTWYAEATSTWFEDELYNDVNQLYSYIPAWFSHSQDDTSTGGGYGRWIFNRYLAEKHGLDVVRSVWEKIGSMPSPDGHSDIPMAPVLTDVLSSSLYSSSLSTDFFGFAKRVYTKNWPLHLGTDETADIHSYSPVATYRTYPINSSSSPVPAITLSHYSFAYYRLIPASNTISLTVSINKSSGLQTALFKNSSEISANGNGTSYTVNSLGTADEVVLLIANCTAADGENANFSTDGVLTEVIEPSTPKTSSSSSGCFIATAAYGSYLHPQVQQLRSFRDRYLLATAPGRTFVALYYRYSPPLADVIARHPFLRGITRLLLTPVVAVVVHPLLSVMALLFSGAGLMSWRRTTAARALSQSSVINITSRT